MSAFIATPVSHHAGGDVQVTYEAVCYNNLNVIFVKRKRTQNGNLVDVSLQETHKPKGTLIKSTEGTCQKILARAWMHLIIPIDIEQWTDTHLKAMVYTIRRTEHNNTYSWMCDAVQERYKPIYINRLLNQINIHQQTLGHESVHLDYILSRYTKATRFSSK